MIVINPWALIIFALPTIPSQTYNISYHKANMLVSYIICEQNVFTTAVSQIFEVYPTRHSNGYTLQVDAFFEIYTKHIL